MKITRDAIFDLRPRVTGWYVLEGDGGGIFEVLHVDRGSGIGYALSRRTGLVVRWVQTGTVPRRNGMMRVRLQFPVDTGDAAGTLEFTPDYGQGGWISPDLKRVTGEALTGTVKIGTVKP